MTSARDTARWHEASTPLSGADWMVSDQDLGHLEIIIAQGMGS